jgi:hypothetical protein
MLHSQAGASAAVSLLASLLAGGVLTEIYICGVCSCQAILSSNLEKQQPRGQGSAACWRTTSCAWLIGRSTTAAVRPPPPLRNPPAVPRRSTDEPRPAQLTSPAPPN